MRITRSGVGIPDAKKISGAGQNLPVHAYAQFRLLDLRAKHLSPKDTSYRLADGSYQVLTLNTYFRIISSAPITKSNSPQKLTLWF